MLMYCSEAWTFYLVTLIAGYISVEDQAVQGIIMVIATSLFMFGEGMQEASSTLVGNMIGANRVGFAWHYAQVLSAMTMIVAFFIGVLLFMNIDKIAAEFTDDLTLQNMLIEVLPIIFICFFFDAV